MDVVVAVGRDRHQVQTAHQGLLHPVHVDVVVRVVDRHQQLAEDPVGVSDVARRLARVTHNDGLERGAIVLGRQQLEPVHAILVLVDQELSLDPLRGLGVLGADVVTQGTQSEVQARQTLLTVDHQPPRRAPCHRPGWRQHQ